MNHLVQTKKYQYQLMRFLTDEESQAEKQKQRSRARLQRSRLNKNIKKLVKRTIKNYKMKLMFLTDGSSEDQNESQQIIRVEDLRQNQVQNEKSEEKEHKDEQILVKDLEEKAKLSNYFRDRIMFHSLANRK